MGCLCSPREIIFQTWDLDVNLQFVYMYETFFNKLGLRLLLIDFECLVLSQINIASLNFIPNGWTFLCSFEILMIF